MTPNTNEYQDISIPAALLLVLEDVGWWNGRDGSLMNQPYRTGMNRQHCPEDYEAIAILAKRLGTQILAGFVLCEWDRENILSHTPSTTWMGNRWRNEMKNSPLLDKAAVIVNDNRKHIEIGLHGVGHEFWENGVVSRSEFHDSHGNMRNRDDVRKHLALFGEILRKSGMEVPSPEIFIPPALKHSFGNGDHGFQKLLAEFGVRFVLAVFDKSKQYAPPVFPNVHKECGVTLVERGLSPVNWNAVASPPVFPCDWPVLPLHWSNILHHNPAENTSVVESWADYLLTGAKEKDFILLPDAKDSLVQIVFSQLADVVCIGGNRAILLDKVNQVLNVDRHTGFYLQTPLRDSFRIKGGRSSFISYQSDGTALHRVDHIKSKELIILPDNNCSSQ